MRALLPVLGPSGPSGRRPLRVALQIRRFCPKGPRLLRAKKAVLLPHMGSATIEGRIDMGEKVIINIKTWVDGHNPPDRVLPSML